jgi:hypothetical protein
MNESGFILVAATVGAGNEEGVSGALGNRKIPPRGEIVKQ